MLKIALVFLLSISLSSVAMDLDSLNCKLFRAATEKPVNADDVRSLVAAGADINHLQGSRSLLHWAASVGNGPACMLLLELGANPDTIDRDDKDDGTGVYPTPLMAAVDRKLADVCCLMIEKRANIHRRDNNGKTALWAACLSNLYPVCKLLIEEKAEIDIQSKVGLSTPLCHCAFDNKAPLCKLLLQSGANPFILNAKGRTPLLSAATRKSDATIMVILNHILFPLKDGIKTFLCCLLRLKSNDNRLHELYRQSKQFFAPWLFLAMAEANKETLFRQLTIRDKRTDLDFSWCKDADIIVDDDGFTAWEYHQIDLLDPKKINQTITYLINKQLGN